MKSQSLTPPPSVVPACLGLRGRLEPAILERALKEVVRRHAALRTAFIPTPGISPEERIGRLRVFTRTGLVLSHLHQQCVAEDVQLPIATVDLTQTGSSPDNPACSDVCQQFLLADFDLAKPPLMRVLLAKLAADEHLLLLVCHHLVCDAQSARIICNEFAALYRHYTGVGDYPFGSVPYGFSEYAVWQQERLKTDHYAQAAYHWREHWAKFGSARCAPSDFPFALTPPRAPSFVFESVALTFRQDDAKAILAFARSCKVTLHMLLSAAFAAVLHHYTGKAAIGLWNHCANRNRRELTDAVGYFMNSHLIGLDFGSDPTGRDLLTQARKTIAEGVANAELPLALLWPALRCYPRYPDIKVLLETDIAPAKITELTDDLTMTREPAPKSSGPRFSALGVYARQDGRHLSFSVQYAVDLFLHAAIQALAEDLEYAVLALVRNPEKRISEMSQIRQRYSDRPARTMMEMSEFVVIGSDLIPGFAQ